MCDWPPKFTGLRVTNRGLWPRIAQESEEEGNGCFCQLRINLPVWILNLESYKVTYVGLWCLMKLVDLDWRYEKKCAVFIAIATWTATEIRFKFWKITQYCSYLFIGISFFAKSWLISVIFLCFIFVCRSQLNTHCRLKHLLISHLSALLETTSLPDILHSIVRFFPCLDLLSTGNTKAWTCNEYSGLGS